MSRVLRLIINQLSQCNACVHVCVCHFAHATGSMAVISGAGTTRRVIVLDSAPSFHNQKEDFLSRHCKRGKREYVSAPVFLLLGIPSCYCTTLTECIRFTQTLHPNKAHTDLCQVTRPTSINLKISS